MSDKMKMKFSLRNHRWLIIGIAGIALSIEMIIAALVTLRLQSQGFYQTPPTTGDGWSTASLRWHGKFARGNTDVIYSAGWGGQFIFIMPSIKTVVLMTGSNYDHRYNDMVDIVNRYVLGSIVK